jgi:protein ImuB
VRLVPVHTVDLADPAGRSGARPTSVLAPWPGQVPDPAPALVHTEAGPPPPTGVPVELVDERGAPLSVSGRSLLSADPARLHVGDGPAEAVVAWAGPWPADERWWDPPAHRRRARLQLVTASGQAHLVVCEGRRWWLEATYD